jgi:hypothetical protein
MTKEIPLTRGRVALVDDADYPALAQHKWSAHRGPTGYEYAARGVWGNGRVHSVAMHRVILAPPPDCDVDHIDHNALNNQRANLRLCTASQNGANARKCSQPKTSEYKGVCWATRHRRWVAKIKRRQIGYFKNEADAARAYNIAAFAEWGHFAHLNTNTPPPTEGD